jgi:hypothetical protein
LLHFFFTYGTIKFLMVVPNIKIILII